MSSPFRWGLLAWALVAGSLSVSCGQAFGPEAVASALQRAYPGWVEVVPGTGEPLFRIDGRMFAWAEGRLLPWEQRDNWNTYSPQPFYEYPSGEPDVASWSDETLALAEARLADRRTDAPKRSSAFFNALWSSTDRGSADAAQRRIRFFGLPVTVHRSLVAALARIEARLNGLRASDTTLDTFLNNLKGFDGYNWRDIAETQSRSNHAYGAAIDLIARSYGGKNPYWLWAPQGKPGWYKTAWAHRWTVPPAFVQAFEDEGFVWGGKWLLFDTIHFEYRPEILILNGLR